MHGAWNGLDLNIQACLLKKFRKMDHTNLLSAIQTMFAGTSFESNINNLLTNQEFLNCMMAFQLMIPTSMPTTQEEKETCIQSVNEGFDSNPAFQTPMGLLFKPHMKAYLCEVIESPRIDTVVGYMDRVCVQVGVGVNDREDLRNGLMTAVDAIATEPPPANPEPPTEN